MNEVFLSNSGFAGWKAHYEGEPSPMRFVTKVIPMTLPDFEQTALDRVTVGVDENGDEVQGPMTRDQRLSGLLSDPSISPDVEVVVATGIYQLLNDYFLTINNDGRAAEDLKSAPPKVIAVTRHCVGIMQNGANPCTRYYYPLMSYPRAGRRMFRHQSPVFASAIRALKHRHSSREAETKKTEFLY